MRVQTDLSDLPVSEELQKRQEQAAAEAKNIVQYYLDNYAEVYELRCDKCKSALAIEYLDLANPNPHHHQGRQVIPTSNKMRSYRPRLDGAMGYQCACGNDTKLASVEAGIVPVAERLKDGTLKIPEGSMEIQPHHHGLVAQKISATGYVADVHARGKDIITETFRVKRIK